MKTLSVTDTEQLIMTILLYSAWGLSLGILVIGIIHFRKKKEKVSKDINRDFKFI